MLILRIVAAIGLLSAAAWYYLARPPAFQIGPGQLAVFVTILAGLVYYFSRRFSSPADDSGVGEACRKTAARAIPAYLLSWIIAAVIAAAFVAYAFIAAWRHW
jgi:hypothetical protein